MVPTEPSYAGDVAHFLREGDTKLRSIMRCNVMQYVRKPNMTMSIFMPHDNTDCLCLSLEVIQAIETPWTYGETASRPVKAGENVKSASPIDCCPCGRVVCMNGASRARVPEVGLSRSFLLPIDALLRQFSPPCVGKVFRSSS